MDSSNRSFKNLLNQESPSLENSRHYNSPPQQFPNRFLPSQFSQSFNPNFLHNFYPFGAPGNYPPYGYSPPSFQATQRQGNWIQANSPNQVFGAASSHGSESSIPCPTTTRQQEKQPLNIEELSDSSEEGVRRAPRTNWKEEENLRFVSAWLNNSVDSVDGNDKKSEYYWKDVADEFNSNMPRNAHTRTVKQMKTHWDNVKRDIAKFCGAYAQVRNTCTSEYFEDMIMEKAHTWYKNQAQQKSFTLEYMWREQKDQPKGPPI
ncbi:glutathione S-transferase T3-like [Oryza sativa Japonica Group]|uniref:glutathione S-transferase T3-like n=1 Tax=Oryza sativa subsp. japonica TaxID=39947 RepID=UPI000E1C312B|nr:glutathione S-transferase T3-like [Oryza sativa Japonica Group]